jgi:hypothetical protein
MNLEDLQDINNLNDFANEDNLPEEASGLLCENREGCKTCNVDDPLYCDECNDGFELQKLEG